MRDIKVFLPNKASKKHIDLLVTENRLRDFRSNNVTLFGVLQYGDIYLLEGSHRAYLAYSTNCKIKVVYVDFKDIDKYEAVLDCGNLVCVAEKGNKAIKNSELFVDGRIDVKKLLNSYSYKHSLVPKHLCVLPIRK